jgi:pimeloyl-ACP methyl ester carboxylesterase
VAEQIPMACGGHRNSKSAKIQAMTSGNLMAEENPAVVPVRKGYARGRFGLIHYRIAEPPGTERRIPLLCFHMSPNSSRIYETFLGHMGRDRIAIAADTPGFGDSDPPSEPPGIADYAAAMGDLIDALGLETVDVMGYHTGSETCVEIALQRPAQVRRLVLVSGPIFTDEELTEHRVHYGDSDLSEDGSHLAEKWRGHLYWAMQGWTPEHVARHFPDAMRRPGLAWWGHSAAFAYPFADKLALVKQPILLLNPEDDLHEQSLRAKDILKNGRIHELPGWGHGFLELFTTQAATVVRSHLDSEG